MAELAKIEKMRIQMEALGMNPNPLWILGTQTGPLYNGHISGEMREMSDKIRQFAYCKPQAILLAEAAERLDDAHQDWMEWKLHRHGIKI